MGPLAGLKIIELAGIGAVSMSGMLLADMGATVLRMDRIFPSCELCDPLPFGLNPLLRSRKSIELNWKQPEAVQLVLRLIEQADGLIEGFRPGVTERLGLGPDACLKRNPRLVYGRVTGWGQDGPLSSAAGHDINYIAITGALHAIGRKDQPPTPPLNLLGDYGGGTMYLVLGMLAGLLEARHSGKGQVVDAAIVDGTAALMTAIYGRHSAGQITSKRGMNVTDSGAYFYDVYECSDGLWVSIAPMEGRFHAEFLRRMGIDPRDIGDQRNSVNWPNARAVVARCFSERTRKEWCKLLEGTDACFAPVLSMEDAPLHPHLEARRSFVKVSGVTQPAPAPRFSRTVADKPTPPNPVTPENTEAALSGWLSRKEVAALRAAGTLP